MQAPSLLSRGGGRVARDEWPLVRPQAGVRQVTNIHSCCGGAAAAKARSARAGPRSEAQSQRSATGLQFRVFSNRMPQIAHYHCTDMTRANVGTLRVVKQ